MRNFKTLLAKMAEIEGAIGQSLSIVFVRAVNTKLASLFDTSSLSRYLTVILRTRVEYELIADEASSAESAIAHIRRE